jgi:hypothetical protein
LEAKTEEVVAAMIEVETEEVVGGNDRGSSSSNDGRDGGSRHY